MFKQGFLKVAAITPTLRVGNPMYNVDEMIRLLGVTNAAIAVFPELSITGYTCNDLFFQDSLLKKAKEAVKKLLANNPFEGIVILGTPFQYEGALYNVAVAIQKDKILGIVPKLYLPNTGEFYEKRWFQSGFHIIEDVHEVDYLGHRVPFGLIVFEDLDHELSFGIEVCEDMWAPFSPGNILSLNGARVIFNLSASNEVLGKRKVRRRAILDHSRRNAGGYVYCSAGVNESSSETVFSGHNVIAQSGELLVETEHFKQESEVIYGDLDLIKIDYSRRTNASYRDSLHRYPHLIRKVLIIIEETLTYEFSKPFDQTPFVPKTELDVSYEKIAALQENALIKRLKHINTNKVIIGISGGLDSTLALLIACKVFDAMSLDRRGIIAVTMPGLHTSKITKQNSLILMKKLNVTAKEIDIQAHVKEHFKLIGHNENTEDITYENTQARIRTTILMNLANKYGGIVLGTGDLSELALGWCTYNGDQMSMYSINAGIPKTLVRFMIEQYAKHEFKELSDTLLSIIDTPITPELRSNQTTEETIGKYTINDFIIHRVLRHGDDKHRLEWLLPKVFFITNEQSNKYVQQFFKRFYMMQFKRQTLPDGPKVLDISISPRGDLRLPSDLDHHG